MSDKDLEKSRHDSEADIAIRNDNFFSVNKLTLPLKTPYLFYQEMILDAVSSEHLILEIGAGMGENTGFLLATGAQVCVTDISLSSLSVIEKRFNKKFM